ncbi:hypothetical protein [Paraburkholderia susongensis]|uniref:Holin of 3TMs, for gene-transfer release n=1 Tax=Paraburkholderia susongensis TaxID=1515439 RepID=A0A1X7I475_9BURK|nr:hypothetical protein [Paraburkholderia susongensis]SMG09218.1 hypothetical protein SAMN06265784_101311 [Paraburkholderia susongensis]
MLSAIMTLVGALGGGLLRLLPEMLSAWGNRQSKENAVELARVELESKKADLDNKLEIAKLGAENIEAEGKAALDRAAAEAKIIAQTAQAQLTGVKWADGLNLSVRPITTYLMLVLYICFKFIVIRDAVIQAASPSVATVTSLAALVWDQDDAAIFAAILAFWFADSAIARRKKP